MTTMRRAACLLGLGLVAVGLLAWWFRPSQPSRPSEERYQAVLDDIMGVESVFRSPTPDPTCSRLAYIHGASQGRGLYVLDLTSLDRREVDVTNEVTQISGWSPDGRYLTFVQESSQVSDEQALLGNAYAKETWVTVYDTSDRSVRRLTDSKGVIESHFFWLTTNTYLLTSRRITNDLAEMFLGQVGERVFKKVSNYMPEFVLLSETRAGYAYKSTNIFELEIKPLKESARWGWDDSSRTVRQLSQFGANQFDAIKWLRCSRETEQFLFCARPTNSPWRYLFRFDPTTRKLAQLNNEDTYNGQWLQGGTGFAYVGNRNNSFFLAVRPQDPDHHTNLFLRGSVVNYQVAPDGNHLFATASIGVEPQGLWEYNLTNRALRRIADGLSHPLVTAKVIEPLEYRVKSFDGLEIPCFWFRPGSHGVESKTSVRQSKRSAVIFLSPRTGQFQRSFDARAQLLANLGFHFVAVNYRGCDGYGRDYASLGNPADAAQDILAVYDHLVNDPAVDRRNVFLATSSDGAAVAYELLTRAANLWRGVALENPTAPMFEGRFDPGRLPPIFFLAGDQDSACASLRQFQAWGRANGAAITSVIYTNVGHITFKSTERKDMLKKESRFYLDQLR